MNLIFLDIDGVLNSVEGSDEILFDMEVTKLKLLKQLTIDTNSQIVVISDWRYSSRQRKQLLEAFNKYQIPIHGMLRDPSVDDEEDNRGKQIQDYLESHRDIIDKIVILDDNDDGILELFHEDFIKTNKFYGLDESIVNKVKEVFKNN